MEWQTFCRACEALDSIRSEVRGVDDDGVTHGVYACNNCGASYGIWIDAGTLDLATVRESDLNADNDFWVYEGPLIG